MSLIQRRLSKILLPVCVAAALLCNALLAAEIQFNRDVRPILSDKCFHCHGPDNVAREADLRLDTMESAYADRDGGRAIVPGKPELSELISRITHEDPDQRMPPEDSGRNLTANEIETLKRWVEQGAKWQKHWSFITPQRGEPPAVQSRESVQNAIDQFVVADLERRGLALPASASRTTLIRRVTQDLTGLPPTIAEIDEFLNDDSSRAYEQLVDRLLESPHYGERMAIVWLDAARYADSHGYSLDRRRVMWPWRDWVIDAYNRNLAFDEFVREQIAGDLLPGATISQQVATGFNRNHPIQSEGGVINEEYRVETVVDRVETTSAVFLGLTMGCSRCHDHKYEPISQKEFYQFYAFFNNVPESAHVGNSDNQADRPFIKAPTAKTQSQRRDIERELAQLDKELKNAKEKSPPKMTSQIWIDDELPAGAEPFGNGGGPQEFKFVDKADHPVFHGTRSSYRASEGRGQHGFHNAKPGLPAGLNSKLFTYVYLDPKNPPQQIMLQWNDGRSWEHRAYWGGNHIAWGTDNSTSRLRMGDLPELGKWVRLEVDAAQVGIAGSTITGWAFTQFDGTVYWDNAGIVDVEPNAVATKIARLKTELASLDGEAPTVMVMAEMNPPRKTFVLARGQYDQPTDQEVQAGVPAVLGALPDGAPRDRLALADWLVAVENPLTARVAVNRYWQMYFNHGLIKTPEDFGTQGGPPSHPELLDWLATEFVRTGWDVKAMQKLIVMSATYRADSRVTKELIELDPENRLLTRGPRFRLSAELIRDHALSVSGLLVKNIGGPSVRTYQPPGLWDDVVYGNAPRFKQDHGDKLYRRSMYIYWKRSVPPPNLQALDAPSREACTLRRSVTNTPQGALVLMNDPTFVEAARMLAERSIREGGSTSHKRLEYMGRLVLGRTMTAKEMQMIHEVWSDLKTDYAKKPEAAKSLMEIGEFPRDETLNVVEVAAFTAIANAYLSLDETITRN
jgi:hypothetical protein